MNILSISDQSISYLKKILYEKWWAIAGLMHGLLYTVYIYIIYIVYYIVVILVCELDIGLSVIRWWIRSKLLVSILITPVSRLHSHRYRLNWLATQSSHSLINLSGQLHTNDHTTHEHCISLPSHYCSLW